MAEVVLKNLNKTYDNGFQAVHGIDLSIREGELMVLVGPSGCAKSTTLRMIAGLESISDGNIQIGGKVVNDLPPKDRGIAMVFQNYALYPHMTAFDNMAFGLKQLKLPKDEMKERIEQAAEKLEISHLLHKRPGEMSGGQRQRIALGRAMVRKPDVFLFDEPLSNLDAKLRVSTRDNIARLHEELKAEGQNATMVYVTHDQVEAMTLGDRICVLNHGRVMQVDTPMNLYSQPANKFVAGFIGSPSMNLIPAELFKKDGELWVSLGDKNTFCLPGKFDSVQPGESRKVWFGIRPEHISLSVNRSDTSFTALTRKVELMGNESYCYFTLNGHEMTARVAGQADVPQGGITTYELDMSKCHLFDFESEQSL